MLYQLRAWFRRTSKRRDTSDAISVYTNPSVNYTDPKASPPTCDSLGPIPRALTPLAQREPAAAACYHANLSASAITARAIAEGPDAASAMDKGLRRIRTAVPEVIRSCGLEHDHRLVDFIWAAAISASADAARIIAQSPNPSCAIDLARNTEAGLANGSADALALYCIDIADAGSGVRVRHRLSLEPRTHPKDGFAGRMLCNIATITNSPLRYWGTTRYGSSENRNLGICVNSVQNP